MSTAKLRRGLINVSLLTVQDGPSLPVVDGEVVPKTDREGIQKKTEFGVPQWTVEVVMPNGRGTISQRVTIVSDARPNLVDGDLVVFKNLVAGAFADGRNAVLYFTAEGVQRLGHVDDSSAKHEMDGVLAGLDD